MLYKMKYFGFKTVYYVFLESLYNNHYICFPCSHGSSRDCVCVTHTWSRGRGSGP